MPFFAGWPCCRGRADAGADRASHPIAIRADHRVADHQPAHEPPRQCQPNANFDPCSFFGPSVELLVQSLGIKKPQFL